MAFFPNPGTPGFFIYEIGRPETFARDWCIIDITMRSLLALSLLAHLAYAAETSPAPVKPTETTPAVTGPVIDPNNPAPTVDPTKVVTPPATPASTPEPEKKKKKKKS